MKIFQNTQSWHYWNFYRPQWSCGQGYIFTPICHSVHRGGLPQCMLGCHTPPREAHAPPPCEQNSPWEVCLTACWEGSNPPGSVPHCMLGRKHLPPGKSASLHAGKEASPPGSLSECMMRRKHPPSLNTVNKRPVRILLECILVGVAESHGRRIVYELWRPITDYHHLVAPRDHLAILLSGHLSEILYSLIFSLNLFDMKTLLKCSSKFHSLTPVFF